HRYGGIRLDDTGVVSGFVAAGPTAKGSFHFIGVQVAAAEMFHRLPAGTHANTIGGLYDALIAARPGSIRGFVSDASFWDVGTPADYLETSRAFQQSDTTVGRRLHLDPSAIVAHSILWDDVAVGPECRIDRCLVTDRVRVPARSSYRDAALVASSDGSIRSYPLSQ